MLDRDSIERLLDLKHFGWSLREISHEFGLTEIEVCNVLRLLANKKSALVNSKYPAIASWQLINGVSMSSLAKKIGIVVQTICDMHTGRKVPSKFVIDGVLSITGLTYEEAFREADK